MSAFLLLPFARLAALLGVAGVALAACAPTPPLGTRGVRDDYGAIVDTVAPVARIVTLNPTTTELLFAIGAGDRVVGRSRWDQWPAEARNVPEVGDAIRPSVERILAARADLVVLYASGDNRDAARALSAAGVRVAAFRVDRIADFARVARALGALTKRPGEAAMLVDTVSQSLERVRQRHAHRSSRPTVFLHVWDNPLMAIGGGSFLSELVEIAGGRNVYADRPEPSLTISFEDLLQRNPDVVLAGPTTERELYAPGRWERVRAVRERRVVVYDTMLVARPSVRLGEAAASLEALLHAPTAPLRAPADR